jgi:hypothetical protein
LLQKSSFSFQIWWLFSRWSGRANLNWLSYTLNHFWCFYKFFSITMPFFLQAWAVSSKFFTHIFTVYWDGTALFLSSLKCLRNARIVWTYESFVKRLYDKTRCPGITAPWQKITTGTQFGNCWLPETLYVIPLHPAQTEISVT